MPGSAIGPQANPGSPCPLSPPGIKIPMPAATVHPTQRLRREPAALSASGADPRIVAPRDRVSRQAHARSVDVVGSLVATVAISDHTGAGDLCAAVHMIRGGGRPLMPNRGCCEFVCLCSGLYVTNGRSDRQFSIVIRIGGAPYAGSERHRFALRHVGRPGYQRDRAGKIVAEPFRPVYEASTWQPARAGKGECCAVALLERWLLRGLRVK
jgi:hypothetical protein